MKNEFQIFISYARPDREEALELFHWLSSEGYNVWIDCKKLLPGQNWDFEIQRALEKSALILFLWSKNSRNRRGYIQKELKLALEKRKEKLIDDTYLIPIVLDDDSELPSQLQPIQSVSRSDPVFSSALLQTLNNQLDRLGFERTEKQKKQDVHWSSKIKKEIWDGLPGYEIEYQLFNFDSNIYLSASEIGKYIEGDLLRHLFEHRSQKLNKSPDIFNYAQDKWRRTNTLDAHANDPILKGRVLSLQYAVHWYETGASHPNYYFKTYSFIL